MFIMKIITEMVHRNTSKVYIFALVTAVIPVSTCSYDRLYIYYKQ